MNILNTYAVSFISKEDSVPSQAETDFVSGNSVWAGVTFQRSEPARDRVPTPPRPRLPDTVVAVDMIEALEKAQEYLSEKDLKQYRVSSISEISKETVIF